MSGDAQLEPIATLEERREEWSALAEASGNVFLTWEWLSSWWATFGDGHRPALWLVRRDDGSPAAILPLYRDERPPRSLRMIGHTQSDLLGPVCAPGDRDLAIGALHRVLAAEDAADLFVGNSLARSERWAERLPGKSISAISSPILTYADRTWEEILADRSSHFRKRVRYVERRIDSRHEVVWRRSEPDTALDDLELFIELHERRWQGESGAFRGLWGELHRRFVPLAAERGWLHLRFLELDGRVAGALYNLRFGGCDWNYQSGRDAGFEKLEIGLAMNARAIRESLEAGMREYRFLRGAEAYKARLADGDDPVETIVTPLRFRARPLVPLLRIAPRLPTPARRRLQRLVT